MNCCNKVNYDDRKPSGRATKIRKQKKNEKKRHTHKIIQIKVRKNN